MITDLLALGASTAEVFLAWEQELPGSAVAQFQGDRVRLLCGALLVPLVNVIYVPGGAVSVRYPGREVQAYHHSLLLTAAIVLVADYLDRHGRGETVPPELRAVASSALMLGMEIR